MALGSPIDFGGRQWAFDAEMGKWFIFVEGMGWTPQEQVEQWEQTSLAAPPLTPTPTPAPAPIPTIETPGTLPTPKPPVPTGPEAGPLPTIEPPPPMETQPIAETLPASTIDIPGQKVPTPPPPPIVAPEISMPPELYEEWRMEQGLPSYEEQALPSVSWEEAGETSLGALPWQKLATPAEREPLTPPTPTAEITPPLEAVEQPPVPVEPSIPAQTLIQHVADLPEDVFVAGTPLEALVEIGEMSDMNPLLLDEVSAAVDEHLEYDEIVALQEGDIAGIEALLAKPDFGQALITIYRKEMERRFEGARKWMPAVIPQMTREQAELEQIVELATTDSAAPLPSDFVSEAVGNVKDALEAVYEGTIASLEDMGATEEDARALAKDNTRTALYEGLEEQREIEIEESPWNIWLDESGIPHYGKRALMIPQLSVAAAEERASEIDVLAKSTYMSWLISKQATVPASMPWTYRLALLGMAVRDEDSYILPPQLQVLYHNEVAYRWPVISKYPAWILALTYDEIQNKYWLDKLRLDYDIKPSDLALEGGLLDYARTKAEGRFPDYPFPDLIDKPEGDDWLTDRLADLIGVVGDYGPEAIITATSPLWGPTALGVAGLGAVIDLAQGDIDPKDLGAKAWQNMEGVHGDLSSAIRVPLSAAKAGGAVALKGGGNLLIALPEWLQERTARGFDRLGWNQPLVDAADQGIISDEVLRKVWFTLLFQPDKQKELIYRTQNRELTNEMAIREYGDPFMQFIGLGVFDPLTWSPFFFSKGFGVVRGVQSLQRIQRGITWLRRAYPEAEALINTNMIAKAAARPGIGRAAQAYLKAAAKGDLPSALRIAILEELNPKSALRGLSAVFGKTQPYGGGASGLSDIVGRQFMALGARPTLVHTSYVENVSWMTKFVNRITKGKVGVEGPNITSYANIRRAQMFEMETLATGLVPVLDVWDDPVKLRRGIIQMGNAYNKGNSEFVKWYRQAGLGYYPDQGTFGLAEMASHPEFIDDLANWGCLKTGVKLDPTLRADKAINGLRINKAGTYHPYNWKANAQYDLQYGIRHQLDRMKGTGVSLYDPSKWDHISLSNFKPSFMHMSLNLMKMGMNRLYLTTPRYHLRNAFNNWAMLTNVGAWQVRPWVRGVDVLADYGLGGEVRPAFAMQNPDELLMMVQGVTPPGASKSFLSKITSLSGEIEGNMRVQGRNEMFPRFYNPQYMEAMTSVHGTMLAELKGLGLTDVQFTRLEEYLGPLLTNHVEILNPVRLGTETRALLSGYAPYSVSHFWPTVVDLSEIPLPIRREVTSILRKYTKSPNIAKGRLNEIDDFAIQHITETFDLRSVGYRRFGSEIGEFKGGPEALMRDALKRVEKLATEGYVWEEQAGPALGLATARIGDLRYGAEALYDLDEIRLAFSQLPEARRLVITARAEQAGITVVDGTALVNRTKGQLKRINNSTNTEIMAVWKDGWKGTSPWDWSENGVWTRTRNIMEASEDQMQRTIRRSYDEWNPFGEIVDEVESMYGVQGVEYTSEYTLRLGRRPEGLPNWLGQQYRNPGVDEYYLGGVSTELWYTAGGKEASRRFFNWMDTLTPEQVENLRFTRAVDPNVQQQVRDVIIKHTEDLALKARDIRTQALGQAEGAVNWALHNYMAAGDADYLMTWFFPWQFWWTRSLPKFALDIANRPYIGTALIHYHKTIGEEASEYWERARLSGKMRLPFPLPFDMPAEIAGDVYVDPWRLVIPHEVLRSHAWEEEVDGVIGDMWNMSNRFLGVNPLLNFGLAVSGARGPRAKGQALADLLTPPPVQAANILSGLISQGGFHIYTGPEVKYQLGNILENWYGNNQVSDPKSEAFHEIEQLYTEAHDELKSWPNSHFGIGEPEIHSEILRQLYPIARLEADWRSGINMGTGITYNIRLAGETKVQEERQRLREASMAIAADTTMSDEGKSYARELLWDSSPFPSALLSVSNFGDVPGAGYETIRRAREDYYYDIGKLNEKFLEEITGMPINDPQVAELSRTLAADKEKLMIDVTDKYSEEDKPVTSGMIWGGSDDMIPRDERDKLLQAVMADYTTGQVSHETATMAAVLTGPMFATIFREGVKVSLGLQDMSVARRIISEDMAPTLAVAWWALGNPDLYATTDALTGKKVVMWDRMFDEREQLLEMVPASVQQSIYSYIRDPERVKVVTAVEEVLTRRYLGPAYQELNKLLADEEDERESWVITDDFWKENPPPSQEQIIEWVQEDYRHYNPVLPLDLAIPGIGSPMRPNWTYDTAEIEVAAIGIPTADHYNQLAGMDKVAKLRAWVPGSKDVKGKLIPEPTFYASSFKLVHNGNVEVYAAAVENLKLYISRRRAADESGDQSIVRGFWSDHDLSDWFGKHGDAGIRAEEQIEYRQQQIDAIMRSCTTEATGELDPTCLSQRRPDGFTNLGWIEKLREEQELWKEKGELADSVLDEAGSSGTGVGLEAGTATVVARTPDQTIPYETLRTFYVMGGDAMLDDLRDFWDGHTPFGETDISRLTSLYASFPMGAQDLNTWLTITLPSVFASQSLELLYLSESGLVDNLTDYWSGKVTQLSADMEADLYRLFRLTHPHGGDWVQWATVELKEQVQARAPEVFNWLGGAGWLDNFSNAWTGGEMSYDAERAAYKMYDRMGLGAATFNEFFYEKLPAVLGHDVIKAAQEGEGDPLSGFLTFGGSALIDDVFALIRRGEPLSPDTDRELWEIYRAWPGDSASFTQWIEKTLPGMIAGNPARVMAIWNESALLNLVQYWAGTDVISRTTKQHLEDFWRMIQPDVGFNDFVTKTLLEDYRENEVQIFLDLAGYALIDELRAYWETGVAFSAEVRSRLKNTWQRTPMGTSEFDTWLDQVLPKRYADFAGMKIALLTGWERFIKLGGRSILGELLNYWSTGERMSEDAWGTLVKIRKAMPLGSDNTTEFRDNQLKKLYTGQTGGVRGGARATWENFLRAAKMVLGANSTGFLNQLVYGWLDGRGASTNIKRVLQAIRNTGLISKGTSLQVFLDALRANWEKAFKNEIQIWDRKRKGERKTRRSAYTRPSPTRPAPTMGAVGPELGPTITHKGQMYREVGSRAPSLK